jgi:hypothetical protein
MTASKFYTKKIIKKIFEVWTMPGMGQYLTILLSDSIMAKCIFNHDGITGVIKDLE